MANVNQHPLYSRWRFWHQACYNRNCPDYDTIGAQGIRVGFGNFLEMVEYVERELGPQPGPGYRLARIDRAGHYEPGNITWDSPRHQGILSKPGALITYQGQTRTLKEWGELTGLGHRCLYARIVGRGWNLERAFTEPKQRNA